MLNYQNLNDVEFEHVCQDIMERKLGITFHSFAVGRDGGIDLKSYSHNENIIVQVKHYINSPFSNLKSSLKKEIPKVEELNPDQYYICCSSKLSPDNVKTIYQMFSKYMDSEENIITLSEIEDILVAPQNTDILRKHYKLWISSTNILESINSNDIFIDSESLLSNIKFEESLFVQTSAYDKALDYLEKNRCLLITGSPGVGKTITSKMLILHFAAKGYQVRYTTDGSNLSSLKKALSQSPNTKEIILLDDCLGQAYFNMKETQSNELLSIIHHIKFHKNKILLMNSRVTIYQEAKVRTPELLKSFETKDYKVFVIDMDAMPLIEKAKILYNHLFFNKIDQAHFEEIKKDKNYLEIIKHKNYNPRIIEFVTNPNRISSIPTDQYYLFILKHLNNPSAVWEDEYTRRLSPMDRLLLTTLYSITNTTAPFDFVKKCFEYRISQMKNIDLTLDHFKSSINHLQKSFIRIIDINGTRMLSMANPSVNDFIYSYLLDNENENNDLKVNSCSVRQQLRMMESTEFSHSIKKAFDNHSILNYIFENRDQKTGYIAYYVAVNNIFDNQYRQYLLDFLTNVHSVVIDDKTVLSSILIIQSLIKPDFIKFYRLESLFFDLIFLKDFLEDFELDDLVKIIKQLTFLYSGDSRKLYTELFTDVLEDSISWYCTNVNPDEFNLDIDKIINQCTKLNYDGEQEIDIEEVEDTVYQKISNIITDEVDEFLYELPEDIPVRDLTDQLTIDINGFDSFIESYIKSDYDDYDYYDNYHIRSYEDTTEIDLIFNR